ncbi:unnamed protein product, partial [Rotaria sp. Silwood1]
MSRVELATRTLSYFHGPELINVEPVDSATLKQIAKRPLVG